MSGQHTRDRLTAITVFYDVVSRLSYSHLQAAKQAFERFSWNHGVTVKHYRAGNGRFTEKLF